MTTIEKTYLQGKKLLVITGEPHLCQLVMTTFSPEGAEIITAQTALAGLRLFYTHRPDLILLSMTLPDSMGWEICYQIRQFSHITMVMLANPGEETEIIKGLNAGADCYLIKPFSSQILLAYIQAIFRRATIYPQKVTDFDYEDGYLSIDLAGHRVLVEGATIKLSVTEFNLLAYLFRHAGQILTFNQILNNIWGGTFGNSADYVHIYIWHLRHKIEKDPKKPVYLSTERTIGYRFVKQIVD